MNKKKKTTHSSMRIGFCRETSNPIRTDAQFGLQENVGLLNSKSCQCLYFIGGIESRKKKIEFRNDLFKAGASNVF